VIIFATNSGTLASLRRGGDGIIVPGWILHPSAECVHHPPAICAGGIRGEALGVYVTVVYLAVGRGIWKGGDERGVRRYWVYVAKELQKKCGGRRFQDICGSFFVF